MGFPKTKEEYIKMGGLDMELLMDKIFLTLDGVEEECSVDMYFFLPYHSGYRRSYRKLFKGYVDEDEVFTDRGTISREVLEEYIMKVCKMDFMDTPSSEKHMEFEFSSTYKSSEEETEGNVESKIYPSLVWAWYEWNRTKDDNIIKEFEKYPMEILRA